MMFLDYNPSVFFYRETRILAIYTDWLALSNWNKDPLHSSSFFVF